MPCCCVANYPNDARARAQTLLQPPIHAQNEHQMKVHSEEMNIKPMFILKI